MKTGELEKRCLLLKQYLAEVPDAATTSNSTHLETTRRGCRAQRGRVIVLEGDVVDQRLVPLLRVLTNDNDERPGVSIGHIGRHQAERAHETTPTNYTTIGSPGG